MLFTSHTHKKKPLMLIKEKYLTEWCYHAITGLVIISIAVPILVPLTQSAKRKLLWSY